MKDHVLAVLLSLALAAPAAAASASSAAPASDAGPRSGLFGAGVELGEQNGATASYWLTSKQSVDAGIGDSAGEVSFHAGYSWHFFDILPQPKKGTFGLYGSLGFRVRDDQFGLRPVGGVDYWVEGHPIEAFVEGGPIFRLTPSSGVDGTGLIGVRFYFDTNRG